MRSISLGSVVLLVALVLLSWDVSRRFAHVRMQPLMASVESVPLADEAAVAAPRAGSEGGTVPDMPQTLAASTNAGSQAPVARAERPAPRARSTATPRWSPPALAVRQVTPGSKAHAEAIASTIQSEEYRNTVEPLARLYFAYFDRTADYEGLNYWIGERDGDVSLATIADEFAGSYEFRQRYGVLDNAAFIDRMYRNVFDGPPDSALRSYWIAQLEAGMSRGQVMLAFSESSAFRAATSNEVFVTLAYAEALGREPDAAGFARWVRFLDAGNPREAVIAGLLARR